MKIFKILSIIVISFIGISFFCFILSKIHTDAMRNETLKNLKYVEDRINIVNDTLQVDKGTLKVHIGNNNYLIYADDTVDSINPKVLEGYDKGMFLFKNNYIFKSGSVTKIRYYSEFKEYTKGNILKHLGLVPYEYEKPHIIFKNVLKEGLFSLIFWICSNFLFLLLSNLAINSKLPSTRNKKEKREVLLDHLLFLNIGLLISMSVYVIFIII